MSVYKEIVENGLWKQNPGVVQLLGLCPTLAVTSTVVNGLSLGLLTALVMAASNGAISPIRRFVPEEIRLPVYILIIAALVTVIDLGMNAFCASPAQSIGDFYSVNRNELYCIGACRCVCSKKSYQALDTGWFYDGVGVGFSAVIAWRHARSGRQRHAVFRY